jgi:hypothetical protein
MTDTHQIRVAGVGTAIGAVIFGALLASSCAPGKLPCDKDDEWRAVCAIPGEGQGGNGGGGGMGGAPGMGGATGAVSAATTIDCAAFPTLGDMDQFFSARCGLDNACHNEVGGLAWKDLKKPGVWERMQMPTATFICAPGKLIDKADWTKSVLWTATRSPKTTCPTGMIARLMPPQEGANITPPQPILTAQENTCLENFLKAIAGAQ